MMLPDHKRPLELTELIWIAVAITIIVLPHSLRIPAWVSVMYAFLLTWRMTGALLGWPLAHRNTNLFRIGISLLAFGCLAGIFLSFHRLVGRDPGVALLVVLAAFKLLEARTERDANVLICVAYILIITNFFYSESIPIAVFMMFATILLTGCFINMNDRKRSLSLSNNIKLASALLALSIPVMVILFMFFPRVAGPLWKMPQDAHSAKTGITDRMSPGSISQLSRSNELAFRVEFEDDIPEAKDMYWRGPVLTITDGRTWTRDQSLIKPFEFNLEADNQTYRYQITLEATNKPWLYSLDTVVTSEMGIISYDAQLVTKKVVRRTRYNATSSVDLNIRETDDVFLNKALILPDGYHPRTRALALEWREQGQGDERIIETALRMFSKQEFYYTLQPPLLSNDNVDQFLFDTRQGFCEHYASAFVILMRAAGIPARVVTGYQGATANPISNHYNVYQRDAHAWAEVYLDDRGWVRFDPTSAVAPERVIDDIEEAISDIGSSGLLNLDEGSLTYRMMRNLRNSWDMMNYRWSLWVLGYDDERQLQLLKRLGIDEFGWQTLFSLLTALFLGLCLTLILIGLFLFRNRFQHADQAQRWYTVFCNKLAKLGYQRYAHEGPADFSERIASVNKNIATAIQEITQHYIEVRYASNINELRNLKKLVRDFNPKFTND